MNASSFIQDAMADIMDSDLGEDALYLPAGGTATQLRAVFRGAAPENSFMRTGANIDGTTAKILRSAMPTAAKGDQIARSYPSDPAEWNDPDFWNGANIAKIRRINPDPSGQFWLLELDRELAP